VNDSPIYLEFFWKRLSISINNIWIRKFDYNEWKNVLGKIQLENRLIWDKNIRNTINLIFYFKKENEVVNITKIESWNSKHCLSLKAIGIFRMTWDFYKIFRSWHFAISLLADIFDWFSLVWNSWVAENVRRCLKEKVSKSLRWFSLKESVYNQ
jgi:hypothetical protein